jgi:hypothetical protein
VDSLTQQLESEIAQTQDRKLKVRAYVDNLNIEKKEIDGLRIKALEELEVQCLHISKLFYIFVVSMFIFFCTYAFLAVTIFV